MPVQNNVEGFVESCYKNLKIFNSLKQKNFRNFLFLLTVIEWNKPNVNKRISMHLSSYQLSMIERYVKTVFMII